LRKTREGEAALSWPGGETLRGREESLSGRTSVVASPKALYCGRRSRGSPRRTCRKNLDSQIGSLSRRTDPLLL
jgi:hypothetical protein